MPAESAILAYAPDFATSLIGQAFPSGLPVDLVESDRLLVWQAFRTAEAKALVSLCDDVLWNDYGLVPALRDEFLGDELAELGRKVLQPEGKALREIRARAMGEVARLRKADASAEGFPSLDLSSAVNPEPSPAARYLQSLSQWSAPTALPEPLKKRVIEAWQPRFTAALRQELKAHERLGAMVRETAPTADDKRYEELSRQSWRLDEILGKLDKWEQSKAGGVVGSTSPAIRRSISGDAVEKSARRFLKIGAVALAVVAVLGAALWIAFSSSPKIESLVASVQSGRVTGLSERLARAAAWMDSAPIPNDVFTQRISVLQGSAADADPISSEVVDAALMDLQRKQLCRAVAGGWVFHDAVRNKYRRANPVGNDWWQRALEMQLAAVPDDEESPESVEKWRRLLPHLIALFESASPDARVQPPMLSLMAALSKGLLANRIEPGRRPALSPDSQEPDVLHKRISVFVETAKKYFEEEIKKIETKYGRYSPEMATAHRLLAEISWRTRELKKEQDSWIRAARVLEKQESKDVREIAFCNLRLGISRALAGSLEGAEGAFAEALKVLRDELGQDHPQVARVERKIARIYADLGQFEPAWKHHQQALVTLMKAYPVPNLEIAALHEEQGEFAIDYRNHARGIELLKRGIEILRKIEYPTSTELARAEGVLSNAEMLAGNLAGAEQGARTRCELLLWELGRTDDGVRDAEIDLAAILLDAGDPAKAEEAKTILKPLVSIPLDAGFPDDEVAALLRCLYARGLAQTGQASEAIAHFDRGIRVLVNTQSRPSLAVSGCLRDFGQVLLDTPRRLDGRKMLEDAAAELSALSRVRPRYLGISSARIEDIRERINKAE